MYMDSLIESFDSSAVKRTNYKKVSFKNNKFNMQDLITIKESSPKEFYEYKEKLGEGAFGQVFRAICKQSKEERAIKILKRGMMNADKIKQFMAETTLLKKISHPSIIRVYDLYSFENNYYVVMEYCKGGEIGVPLKKIKS